MIDTRIRSATGLPRMWHPCCSKGPARRRSSSAPARRRRPAQPAEPRLFLDK